MSNFNLLNTCNLMCRCLHRVFQPFYSRWLHKCLKSAEKCFPPHEQPAVSWICFLLLFFFWICHIPEWVLWWNVVIICVICCTATFHFNWFQLTCLVSTTKLSEGTLNRKHKDRCRPINTTHLSPVYIPIQCISWQFNS